MQQRSHSLASALAPRQPAGSARSALHQLTFGCTVVPPPVEAATDAFAAHVRRLLRLFSRFDDEACAAREPADAYANSLRSITVASYAPYFPCSIEEQDAAAGQPSGARPAPASRSATQYAAEQVPRWFAAHCAERQRAGAAAPSYLCTVLALTGTRDTHCLRGTAPADGCNSVVASIRGATRAGLERVLDHFLRAPLPSTRGLVLTRGLLCMRGDDQGYTLRQRLEEARVPTGGEPPRASPYKDFHDGREVLRAVRHYLAAQPAGEGEAQPPVSLLCADYPQGFFLHYHEKAPLPAGDPRAALRCRFQGADHTFASPLHFFHFFSEQYRRILYEGHCGPLPALETYRPHGQAAQQGHETHRHAPEGIRATATQLLQRVELLLVYSSVMHTLAQQHPACDDALDNDLPAKLAEGATVVIAQAVPDWSTFHRYYTRTCAHLQRTRPAAPAILSLGVMPPLPPFDYARTLLQLKVTVGGDAEDDHTAGGGTPPMTVRRALERFHADMQATLAALPPAAAPADVGAFLAATRQHEAAFVECVEGCVAELLRRCGDALQQQGGTLSGALALSRHVSFSTFAYSSSQYLERLFERLARAGADDREASPKNAL
ncbi:hypothetical protein STCU_11138 [Strigomonas culicis]|uniref:Uncharacterized protein n=1 Tax=Strigomonas culicis TaxID=28005 RepID=S9TEW2_9TRYP|nr:hypothetical protein STCU_11138 [Strigomonas culicis]|eukprot:EPY16577.1 hypothetical protein STCU_11138 [Strigomonas culicis]